MKTSQYNTSKPRGSSADYNANNSWYFNGDNGCFNNNNRYNSNFRSRPVLDYDCYDNSNLDSYPIPLSEWLIIAILTCQGKKRKPTYVHFNLHRMENLVPMTHQVNNFELLPTDSTAHIIFEPRVREIVCACATKRMVQTFYIRTLQPVLERHIYHPNSFSCRVGKGAMRAVQQLEEYVNEATLNYTHHDVWLAKVDLQAFFMSLDCFQVCDIVTNIIDLYMADSPHRELMKYLTRQIYLASTKDHLKDMAKPAERALLNPRKSLYNQPYYRGVPIGDWTSQTAGLIITTPALHYLESLGYRFVHYTDDTVVVVTNKSQWLEDVERLARFYKQYYGLTLHPDKRYLQHYSKGVEALGYKLRFNRLLPSDRIYHNLTWYLERTIRLCERIDSYIFVNRDKILSTINSYLGFLRHCTAYRLRKTVCETVEKSILGMVFNVAGDYTKITIKPTYTSKALYKASYRHSKQLLRIDQ